MENAIPPLAPHTPDNEELAERTECFECGAMVGPGPGFEVAGGSSRGLAVAEGIVLCHACCVRRGGHYDQGAASWLMPPWFDDLVGQGPQA